MQNTIHSIIEHAMAEGKKALESCVPNPVAFYSADLLGNQTGPASIETEGNCGGAYIKGIANNSELHKFFKRLPGMKTDSGIYLRKDVYKGFILSFPVYTFYNGQSHERKKAFYDAAAKVLNDEGFPCRVYDYLT